MNHPVSSYVINDVTLSLEVSWKQRLEVELLSESFLTLKIFLEKEKKAGKVIFPSELLIFNALNSTPFENVKVVIIGQDPYHGSGQAHGLCFSVADGVRIPPSLRNIFKELQDDLNIPVPLSGNLQKWANQGVLLLNAILTVEAGMPGSHQTKGWEQFTDEVIKKLSSDRNGIVFLLWGRFAQAKESLIDQSKHFILKAAHPSPLSAYQGYIGCRHFSKANQLLLQSGQEPVDWKL